MIVKSLNRLGYSVDFYDRSLVREVKKKDYDLLLYNCSGGSGSGLDLVIPKLIHIPNRIALLTSTCFDLREKQVRRRYRLFYSRHGKRLDESRIPEETIGERLKFFTAGLAIGHSYSRSVKSYSGLEIPIATYLPTLPEQLFKLDPGALIKRSVSQNTFVCLSGGGFP